MNIIVAIVGMTGSGKSTASECLVNRGWHHIRFGQVTIDRLKEERREINPETGLSRTALPQYTVMNRGTVKEKNNEDNNSGLKFVS